MPSRIVPIGRSWKPQSELWRVEGTEKGGIIAVENTLFSDGR